MHNDTELLDYLQNRTAETEPHPNGDEMLWCVTDGEGFWHKSTDLRKAIRLAMNLDAINAREDGAEFFDEVLYTGQKKPNHDGLDFSNTKPTGCLPTEKMPRWIAVFEEEAKKPLAVIGIKRDDIKEAAKSYRLLHDLFDGVSNIRDAALRILAEAQGQSTEPFPPLNLDTISKCIDRHAAELWVLRARVQLLESLLKEKK